MYKYTSALLLLVAACRSGDVSQPKIVGGRVADPHAFMASVVWTDGSSDCGGTFVARDIVVTAAHCVVGLGRRIEIRPGPGPDGSAPLLPVQAVAVHPDYDPAHSLNDVAVLVVDGSSVAGTIRPIAFNHDAALPADGSNATVIGRGKISSYGSLFEDVLRQVDVPVVPNDVCDAAYEAKGLGDQITDLVLCAGDMPNGGAGMCKGDSGGPLLSDVNGALELVGIVSGSWGCAQKGAPGVYTRVSAVADWIDAQVQRFSTPPSTVSGAALADFLPNLCYEGFAVTETRGDAADTAKITYAYRPAGPFVSLAAAPVADATQTCAMAWPQGRGPAGLQASLLLDGTPRFRVTGDATPWETPAARQATDVLLTCDATAFGVMFNVGGWGVVEVGGEVYEFGAAAVRGPVATDATSVACEAGGLRAELLTETVAGPRGPEPVYAVRLYGDEFGAEGTIFTAFKEAASQAVQADVSLVSEGDHADTLTLTNATTTDIFTWSLQCNFAFSLEAEAGHAYAAQANAAGDAWSVTLVAPSDARATFLAGASQSFALTLPNGLGASPACAINARDLALQVRTGSRP